MKPVERVRYFDGEYLRAYDLQAEQAYHIAMRRRLNTELHVYGIVEGLDLKPDDDSFPPAAVQFSITPGFGIDRQGREIVLDQPYALANEIVLRRQGIQAGLTYELWICYSEIPTSLPENGFTMCDDPGQQTRFRESFEIILVPFPKPAPKKGETIPDPAKDCGGLRLGTITVVNDALGLRIKTATSEKRTYISLRTQRVIAPNENAAAFDVQKQNVVPGDPPPEGFVDIRPGIFVEGDAYFEKNAVVGDDFKIDPKDVITTLPTPAPAGGNVKIGSNIFLNGGMWANIAGKWYGLKDYIQTFLPEFQFSVNTLTVTATNTDPSTGLLGPITFTSKLPLVTDVQVQAALTGIVLKDKTNLKAWWTDLPGGSPIQVSIAAVKQRKGNSPNQFDISISWTVGPKNVPPGNNPPPAIVSVDSLIVSFMVVFLP